MFKEKNIMSAINPSVEHGHDAQKELFDAQWLKTQKNPIIEDLKEGRDLSEILEAWPGYQEAFRQELNVLDCSDGRVCSGHKMGLAGVGILLSPEERLILEKAIKEKGLVVTGHENCGAAGLAFPGPDSDHHGYDNAKLLAEQTGNTYKEVHRDGFRCAVHNERSLVVEATGRFDCANWEGFPPQFISSAVALGLPNSYVMKEISALTRIALGDHGFGSRFEADNPFYIIVSANSQEQLNQLLSLARVAAYEFCNRVKVQGFVAPEAGK